MSASIRLNGYFDMTCQWGVYIGNNGQVPIPTHVDQILDCYIVQTLLVHFRRSSDRSHDIKDTAKIRVNMAPCVLTHTIELFVVG